MSITFAIMCLVGISSLLMGLSPSLVRFVYSVDYHKIKLRHSRQAIALDYNYPHVDNYQADEKYHLAKLKKWEGYKESRNKPLFFIRNASQTLVFMFFVAFSIELYLMLV